MQCIIAVVTAPPSVQCSVVTGSPSVQCIIVVVTKSPSVQCIVAVFTASPSLQCIIAVLTAILKCAVWRVQGRECSPLTQQTPYYETQSASSDRPSLNLSPLARPALRPPTSPSFNEIKSAIFINKAVLPFFYKSFVCRVSGVYIEICVYWFWAEQSTLPF